MVLRRWPLPGICSEPSATNASMPTVTVMALVTASTIGAKVERAGENTACPISTGLLPGRVMQACTSSLVSPRELSTHSTSLCPRDSPSRESGGDRMELTGLPPTMSSSTAPASTKRSSSSVTWAIRAQQRSLLQRLLGNGHPFQKGPPARPNARPIRRQILARDLGSQTSLLALLREGRGGTIYL